MLEDPEEEEELLEITKRTEAQIAELRHELSELRAAIRATTPAQGTAERNPEA